MLERDFDMMSKLRGMEETLMGRPFGMSKEEFFREDSEEEEDDEDEGEVAPPAK